MKVMLISAIAREGSSCYILAKQVEEMVDAHEDVDVVFVTPQTAGLPLNDGTVDWELPEVKEWQRLVDEIHAHIWVSPEYHSSMTGAFKNLFDYLGKEPMRGDAVGLVALAGGRMAALNTLNGMSVLARSLGAWVAPDFYAVNSNDVKEGLDDGGIDRLSQMIESVVDMTRRLYPEDRS